MFAYGQITKLFFPGCEKQGLKTNQILKIYVLNSILEIHLSDIPSLAVLDTGSPYWERNKTTKKKNQTT